MKNLLIIVLLAFLVIPLKAQTEAYAFARLDGKWGLINQKDETIIPFTFGYLYYRGITYIPNY